MELFRSSSSAEPLASRMRPRTIEEFVGQEHILGKGRLLRRLIQADRLSSIILYGPPGTGKTTLARVISNSTKSRFISLNAVLSGIKDLRIEIEEAKKQQDLYEKRTTLFIDEVHRWNKAQQDALLPWVENGTVILIGATTENPFFEVNPALVSRSRIFQLKGLTSDDLYSIAEQTVSSIDRGYGKYKVEFEEGALDHLIHISDGDARTFLNALELAIETSVENFPPSDNSELYVSLAGAEESIQKKVLLYDKEGDYHFDTISAFIKSIRGSDPDAALYWMARMVKAGEDPRYIFRRMLISACEDIGLADPMALVTVQSAAAAYDRIGMPEGQFHLAQSAIYLATAKKSNSALGFFDAVNSLENEESRDIPNHLKDNNRDNEGFGHGQGYMYPHAFKDHWVAQQYLPKGLKGRTFYTPSDQGYEASLKEEIERKRELQLEVFAPPPPEILTFSPPDTQTEAWFQRTTADTARYARTVRDKLFELADVKRHHRLLITNPGFGSLLWEAVRLVPEGMVYALSGDKESSETLEYKSSQLPTERRPVILDTSLAELFVKVEDLIPFEFVISHNILMNKVIGGNSEETSELSSIRKIMIMNESVSPIWCTAEIVPSLGTTLSSAYETTSSLVNSEVLDYLKSAENALSRQLPWNLEAISEFIENAGFVIHETRTSTIISDRYVSDKDIEKWITDGAYSREIAGAGGTECKKVESALKQDLAGRNIPWSRGIVLLRAGI